MKTAVHAECTRDEYQAIQTEMAALVRIQQRGGHANVVALLDSVQTPDHTHLVLEPTLGGTLRERITELQSAVAPPGDAGGMEEEDAFRIVSQLAAALEGLHAAGVAHRALSPESVYFVESAPHATVKVGALYAAEVAGADGEAAQPTGLVPGLPSYRAPEVWQPAPFAGPPTDMWALGTIAYECLHANAAFEADTLPKLSRQIRQLAHRAYSPALSSAATELMKACFVREPMMRAGPRQMAHLYLRAWGKAARGETGASAASSLRAAGRAASIAVSGVVSPSKRGLC